MTRTNNLIFIQQLTSNKATLENKLFQTQGQDRLFINDKSETGNTMPRLLPSGCKSEPVIKCLSVIKNN